MAASFGSSTAHGKFSKYAKRFRCPKARGQGLSGFCSGLRCVRFFKWKQAQVQKQKREQPKEMSPSEELKGLAMIVPGEELFHEGIKQAGLSPSSL